MTDDLVTWLRAQLDEDERMARDAAGLGFRDLWSARRHWTREAISCVVHRGGGLIVYGEGTPTPEQADHIARHDPGRVVAEVEAKRRILDRCEEVKAGIRDDFTADFLADDVLSLLAVPYADRPGYDERWRP